MRRIFFLPISILLVSFIGVAEQGIGYDLAKPNVSLILPDTLREVSGITYLDSSTVACVQDENGIIFIYDIINNGIAKQFVFNINGDYEGITRVENTIYILRSDGVLFEISDYRSNNFKLTSYITGVPASNNEGLCYDNDKNRLLIACKVQVGKDPLNKDKRSIYGFDLTTKKLNKAPVFEFDVLAIRKFASDNKVKPPLVMNKYGQMVQPIIRFRPSAVSIHPGTKNIYLLSAVDHLLFIFNMEGKIQRIESLDPVMFNKAEGITFFENGDMLIANEAQGKKPTLLRFNYKKS